MKSKLFPNNGSAPKRTGHGGSAGNSQYTHVLPDTNGYKDGMVGWRAGRSAGGTKGANRQVPKPFNNHDGGGEGGWNYDPSLAPYLDDKGKP